MDWCLPLRTAVHQKAVPSLPPRLAFHGPRVQARLAGLRTQRCSHGQFGGRQIDLTEVEQEAVETIVELLTEGRSRSGLH